MMQVFFYTNKKFYQEENYMKFQIPCETYYRLSKILSYFQPDIDDEIKQKINCIRLENSNGILIAVATNQKIAVIEKIGATNQPNGAVHIVVNEKLINQAKTEKVYNSFIEVIAIPQMAMASAKTMLGYTYEGNVAIFPTETPMDDWRDWAADEPIKKSKGAMYWNTIYLNMLNESSLSGKLAFPEFIDTEKPVVLNDIENPNWIGLFMPKRADSEIQVSPAQLPKWWKND